MPDLHFYNGEWKREVMYKRNQTRIRNLYTEVYRDIKKKLKDLEKKTNISSVMERRRLQQLKNQVLEAYTDVGYTLQGIIENGMRITATGIVVDYQKFVSACGVKIKGAMSSVPQDVVSRVVSGKVYQSDWSLSKAIWKDSQRTRRDIDSIIAKGITENRSAYDVAKDLEMYVNPDAKKPWDWGKVYPGSKRVIDYNAQRLSRTLITHAYQQSLIETCKNNPYITGLRWEASNSGRVCPICLERDGKIYPVDDCPLDHPNGMCIQVPVLDRSIEAISQDLADKAAEPLDNPDVEAWKAYMRSQSG